MKYLKKFEAYRRYKINDYILINVKLLTKNLNNLSIPPHSLAKIIDIDYSRFSESPYYIKYPNDEEDAIQEKEIVRLLTSEEIEKYDYEERINKYNV